MTTNGESRTLTKEEKLAIFAAIKKFPTQKLFCKKNRIFPATILSIKNTSRASQKTIKRLKAAGVKL